MKLVYVIGMPGTGKSTLMKAFMNRVIERIDAIGQPVDPNWKMDRPIDLLDTHVCGNIRVLGKYEEGQTFSGTDRLSMAVAPKAIEWIKTKPDEFIVGEGDRLNSKTFFEAVGKDLTIIHLTTSDNTRETRYKDRGSEQSDKFIQTTRTKCKNVVDAFGDRQTLFGEEKGCVVEFSHENQADTEHIVNYMISLYYS